MNDNPDRCILCKEILMAQEQEIEGDIIGQMVWLSFCFNHKCPRYGLVVVPQLEHWPEPTESDKEELQ